MSLFQSEVWGKLQLYGGNIAGKSDKIEDLRIDSDRKQYEVAAYLHLNREVYRRYEKGEREIPVWAVIQLARLYGTSTDYILGLSDRR